MHYAALYPVGFHRLTPHTITPAVDCIYFWCPPTSPLPGWGFCFLTTHCLSLENCPWAKGSHMALGGRYVLFMPSPQTSTLASLLATPSSLTPDKHPAKDELNIRPHCLAFFFTSSCFPHPVTGFSKQDFLNKSDIPETLYQVLLLVN